MKKGLVAMIAHACHPYDNPGRDVELYVCTYIEESRLL